MWFYHYYYYQTYIKVHTATIIIITIIIIIIILNCLHYGIWGNSIVALRCCDSIAFFYLPNENNQFLFQMQALKRTQAYCDQANALNN